MKSISEFTDSAAVRPERLHWDGASKPVTKMQATYVTDRMHRGVFALAIGSYFGMLITVWLFFTATLDVTLAAMVFTAFFGMYFGVPVALHRLYRKSRLEPADGSLMKFARGKLETISGPLTGKAAILQVLIIPVSTTFGLIAMAIMVARLKGG
jgi:hypothetical protein